jgi:hypothetical protein
MTEIDTSVDGVVKRRTKNLRGQKNRKSALHGENLMSNNGSPLSDLNIQIMSVSPEHKSCGEAIESRSGKVLDLVKQFDDDDIGPLGSLSPLGEEGENAEGTEVRGQGSSDGGEDRRKLNRKSLEMFEKSGMIMGMVRY